MKALRYVWSVFTNLGIIAVVFAFLEKTKESSYGPLGAGLVIVYVGTLSAIGTQARGSVQLWLALFKQIGEIRREPSDSDEAMDLANAEALFEEQKPLFFIRSSALAITFVMALFYLFNT